ncbi:MAG TPA: TerC family protein, partial [Planctomycetaceae bacterium]|nr:TerC family protein [Planctomycetaceae bacterium]
AFDLGVFHRKAHVVHPGEALIWSGVWISLALLFNLFLYFAYERHWLGLDLPNTEPDGQTAALAFFTGYILEKSLSVDNIFIIALVFAYFAVPPVYQHRLLYWGILAALLMRGAMILVGVALIEQFHWLLYGFGAILIVTAIRMLFAKEKRQVHENHLVRIVRKWFPVTDDFEGQKFVVRRDGRRYLTPLALALVAVEGADLILAVDSIPAIFAVTEDPFLIFTSNVFAILGLRSLYFALAHVLERLHYLDRSLAAILALIGAKMLFKDVLHGVPGIMLYTLGAIVVILAAGVIASLIWPRPQTVKD